MGTKKGGARKGKPKGSRKAFDDTKDSKKKPSAAATRKKGVTTKKGMARKGTVAGSRLAYDPETGATRSLGSKTRPIRKDRELKPIKTKVRRTKKGVAVVPKPKGNVFWTQEEMMAGGAGKSLRIDEGILRLIDTHYKTDNIIQKIQRLILGKYK